MFNKKVYDRAREIVSKNDVTDLTNRVYKQIIAESELNRLNKIMYCKHGLIGCSVCDVEQETK